MTTNKQEWKVYLVEQTIDQTGQIAGGDDHLMRTLPTSKMAIAYGKKLSMQKKINVNNVHSVWISYRDEEEDLHTTIFITKGVVTNRTTG